jgi:segregation and condensation protein B
MPPTNLLSATEALLFSSDQPLPLTLLCESLESGPEEVLEALHRLGEACAARDAGVELREIAGGWMLVTTAAQAEWVGRLLRGKRRMRLSRAALESMAIIAYKQPVTKSEVEAIRGVDSSAVLATLLERNLVTIRGRSKVVGRPLLYGTTPEFLDYFGLRDLSELPRPEELRALVAAKEPEQLDMMELEVVSQVATDLAASEAAHPELITRHEVVPLAPEAGIEAAAQLATDFAPADQAELSDLAPAGEAGADDEEGEAARELAAEPLEGE